MDNPSTLLTRWLDHVKQLDVPGLLDLYDPQAVLQSWSDDWRGRDEIEDGFHQRRKLLKMMQLDGVRAIEETASSLAFETRVKGKLGRALLRHNLLLDGGRILRHELALVSHEKGVAQ